MVSLDVPLISNLNVLQNIALIKAYHHHASSKEAEALVLSYLEKLKLTHIAFKRNPGLSYEERFCAMLLRAVMVEDNAVLIDRPFKIMPDLKDSRFIGDTLNVVDDLLHNCCIFDYIWNQDRYVEGRV
jgi:ABC-type lipopolysaccharide export system ATPase subunit